MRLAAVVAALITVGSIGVGSADAAGITTGLEPGAMLTVSGHGHGTGVGLSQAGARVAAKKGLGYRHILSFYFPHTTWGTGHGNVSVVLSSDNGALVEVHRRPHLTAHRVGGTKVWHLARLEPRATRWRIWPTSDGRSALQYDAGGWQELSVVSGALEFSAAGAPIRMYHSDHTSVQYRGTLRSDPSRGATVNIVDLDGYLEGVVPLQMPTTWHGAPLLRAQAVAARGFAAYARRTRGGSYPLCDTSACQAYGGYSAETKAGDAAVAATAHQVLEYAGKPARTVWTRSNGGHLRAGGKAYLVAKKDPYDPGAGKAWSGAIAENDIEDHWPSAGPLLAVTPNADASGRWIRSVTIHGQIRDYTVSGDDFAAFAKLPAPWFSLTGLVPPPDPGENVDPPAAPRVYVHQQDVAGGDDVRWPGVGASGTFALTRGVADVTPDIDHYVVSESGPGGSTTVSATSSWDFTPGIAGLYVIDVYAVDTSGRMSAPARVTVDVF